GSHPNRARRPTAVGAGASQDAGARMFTATPSHADTYGLGPCRLPDRRVQPTEPAASLSRLSQDPVAMLSSPRLLGLVCLLTAPLAPGAAQGWIEPIRPLPAFPRGAIVKVRSAVQVTLTGRAARVTDGPGREPQDHAALHGVARSRGRRLALPLRRGQRTGHRPIAQPAGPGRFRGTIRRAVFPDPPRECDPRRRPPQDHARRHE